MSYSDLVIEGIKNAKENEEPVRFVVGKTYEVSSICDHNCKWSFTIIARTEKTVTIACDDFPISKGGKVSRINAKYTKYRKAETVFPFGQYSMCPILSADL